MHALSVATLVVLCGTACAFVHPGGTLPTPRSAVSERDVAQAEEIATALEGRLLKDDVSAARYSLQPVSVEGSSRSWGTRRSPGSRIMLAKPR